MRPTFNIWKTHHLQIFLICLLTALCFGSLGACQEKDVTDSEKPPVDALFDFTQSACDGEECSGYSLHVFFDGTYKISGTQCPNAEPCQGALSQTESQKLFKAIRAFDFASMAAKPSKCDGDVALSTSTYMHLQWDGNEYAVEHNIRCRDSSVEAKLGRFEDEIVAMFPAAQRDIRKERQLSSRAASITNIADCKPKTLPQREARTDISGTVRLRFEVGQDGQLISASVLQSSGFSQLDRVTLSALSRCKFSPAYRDGQPIQSTIVTDYVWDDIN
ncbi:MAG TPA: energy transducer TonB [Burkholderiaceae bacterium]